MKKLKNKKGVSFRLVALRTLRAGEAKKMEDLGCWRDNIIIIIIIITIIIIISQDLS